MKKGRRFVSVVLVLILCLTLLPITIAHAAGDFTIRNGVLIKYTGSGGDVVIPDGVTTIGDSAFARCTGLTSVVIPDSVTEIEINAFWACINLTSVTVGNGLVSIGYKAFADCDSLTDITIPEGVTISSGAFECTGVKEVGGMLTGAGMIAKLPSPAPKVIIPKDSSELEYWLRRYSDNSWSLPQSKEMVFQQIENLVKQLTSGKGNETEKAKAIYDWVSSNISYDWDDYQGNGSTSHGDVFYVFYFRTGVCSGYSFLAYLMLTMAGLPAAYIDGYDGGAHAWNAVYADGRWIEFDATWGMWDLPPNYHSRTDDILFRNGIFTEIIRNDGSIDCQMWDLYDYPSEIIVPNGVSEVSFIDMSGLISVTLPDSMTEISSCGFEACPNLTSVSIPASITKIGDRAFTDCTSLTNIPISNSITEIGAEAFKNCTGLTSVTLPDSVTTIGEGTFSFCENLTSVTIPTSVTEIGMSAFFCCTNLHSVIIANENAKIDEFAFDYYLPPWIYGEPIEGLTVYSTAGGNVENYCTENNIPFVAIIAGFIDIADIPANAWFAEAVCWAVEKGITTGTSSTTFSPDITCTQAQIITFLYRTVGEPAVTGENPYTNSLVTSDQYYYNAMLWAYQNGIVTDASLNPNANCARSDVVTYLWRLAGAPTVGNSDFEDVPASASYAQAVAWAVEQGITTGTSATTFSPDMTCSRGQIVTFLYRAYAAE